MTDSKTLTHFAPGFAASAAKEGRMWAVTRDIDGRRDTVRNAPRALVPPDSCGRQERSARHA